MPLAEELARFSLAFALTQLIEVPIYTRTLGVRRLPAFGASAITHPFVWFVAPLVWRSLYLLLRRSFPWFSLGEVGYFWGYGVLAEGFAVAVEAAYFWRLFSVSVKRALGFAILANATSSLIGLGLQAATGWP